VKNTTAGLGSKLGSLSLRAIASMLRLQNSIIGSLVMSVGSCTSLSILTAKIYLLKQIRAKILSMVVVLSSEFLNGKLQVKPCNQIFTLRLS
jgi:hypothetical protein